MAVIQLAEDFSAVNAALAEKTVRGRIVWAYDEYGDQLAVSSSFGPQSAMVLQILDDLRLCIPVITVDIAGAEQDGQRRYRSRLAEYFNLDLHVFHAVNEADKNEALRRGVRELGVLATLGGVRKAHMEARADRTFIERTHAGPVGINPFVDWSDDDVAGFFKQYPEIKHPEYRPGVKWKNGRILAEGVEKTNCAIQTGYFERQDGPITAVAPP